MAVLLLQVCIHSEQKQAQGLFQAHFGFLKLALEITSDIKYKLRLYLGCVFSWVYTIIQYTIKYKKEKKLTISKVK